MSGVTTATYIAIAGTVLSAGASAYSASQQAKASRDSDNYNAAVGRNNAQIAEWQAQDAVARGNKDVQTHMQKVAAMKGKQTASMAARGLDLSEGTPINILTDTDYMGAQDAVNIKHNASKEAWAYRNQASNSASGAAMSSYQASQASPGMAAGLSLMGSAGSAASRWYSPNSMGSAGKVSQGEMMNLMSDFNDK